ncbi:MAG TPA: S24/S26 family peptidase [Candidatus Binatia bacterium]|nr:S24/S26 family peptidase [Candidatus Binatia bacterium]
MPTEATCGVDALKAELACEVLRRFGTLRFQATGWSMIPAIWPGETLTVRRAGRQGICLGDVVLVEREGRLCTHRVISFPENSGIRGCITQGDANAQPDRPVAESELLGRVIHVDRAGNQIELTRHLTPLARVISFFVRRSFFAARLAVYVRNRFASEESISSCPC